MRGGLRRHALSHLVRHLCSDLGFCLGFSLGFSLGCYLGAAFGILHPCDSWKTQKHVQSSRATASRSAVLQSNTSLQAVLVYQQAGSAHNSKRPLQRKTEHQQTLQFSHLGALQRLSQILAALECYGESESDQLYAVHADFDESRLHERLSVLPRVCCISVCVSAHAVAVRLTCAQTQPRLQKGRLFESSASRHFWTALLPAAGS